MMFDLRRKNNNNNNNNNKKKTKKQKKKTICFKIHEDLKRVQTSVGIQPEFHSRSSVL